MFRRTKKVDPRSLQTLTRPSPKAALLLLLQGGAGNAAPGPAAPEVPALSLPAGVEAKWGRCGCGRLETALERTAAGEECAW